MLGLKLVTEHRLEANEKTMKIFEEGINTLIRENMNLKEQNELLIFEAIQLNLIIKTIRQERDSTNGQYIKKNV